LSVGRLAKVTAADARQNTVLGWQLTQLVSEAFLVGLHQHGQAVGFLLQGGGGRTTVHVGVVNNGAPSRNDNDLLRSMLDGAYPGVELASEFIDLAGSARGTPMTMAGLVRGVPTAQPPDATDGAYAIDRLIRAMSGSEWQALVLAEPWDEGRTRGLRATVLGQMAQVHRNEHFNAPDAVAAHYNRLLESSLEALTDGLSVGAWRVGVYLMGTEHSYPRLAGVWRGVFSGQMSVPEPVRVTEFPQAADLASRWHLPDVPERDGAAYGVRQGRLPYSHPYLYQTILSSSQLAAYVHLPQLETPGLSVRVTPDFDVVPPAVRDGVPVIRIGEVVNRVGGQAPVRARQDYVVERETLSRHTFVTGITGSGKTTTLFHLLHEARRTGLPFLVVEPAKTEYRALLHDDRFNHELQVFTVGAEWASPLRLNPFEIMPGVPVGLHLDLLRSVFGASFGMWVPMPQVLERALYAIYEDRGWDIAGGPRAAEAGQAAIPTLTDLVQKVQQIVPALGFDPEARDRVLASLVTRLNGLRTGAKGRMYDVPWSVGMDTLLGQPTVIELDALGDDDDKAFLMGLLFIRLVEYRRSLREASADNQPHLLVIEEAHRLLTNVPRNTDDSQADPRGKAVETFTNLLSEIRSYDQGVIIVDQVPTRLAPDVIKNTNLKIVHRVVAGDDREALGKAMAMNERQVEALASLPTGHAAVFSSESDDAPLLVKVNSTPKHKPPTDDMIRTTMMDRPNLASSRWRFLRVPECQGSCISASRTPASDNDCQASKMALDAPTCRNALSRLALSVIESPESIGILGTDLYNAVVAQAPDRSTPEHLRCFAVRAGRWLADRWGARRRWSQPDIDRFGTTARSMLLALPPIGEGDLARAVDAFRTLALDLHLRRSAPYRFCDAICDQPTPVGAVCLYRHPVQELLEIHPFPGGLRSAVMDGRHIDFAVVNTATHPVFDLLVTDMEGANTDAEQVRHQAAITRAQLCLVQQAAFNDSRVHPRDADMWVGEAISMLKIQPEFNTHNDGTPGEHR
jgi:hypothetical protein